MHHKQLAKRLIVLAEQVLAGDNATAAGTVGTDANGKRFVLPASHLPGLIVPAGGSSCANCKWAKIKPDGPHCQEPNFVEWNGGSRLPVDDPSTYCSDWWEQA